MLSRVNINAKVTTKFTKNHQHLKGIQTQGHLKIIQKLQVVAKTVKTFET
jgi:hypothetical protein